MKLIEYMYENTLNKREFNFSIIMTTFFTILKQYFDKGYLLADTNLIFDLILLSIPIAIFLNYNIDDSTIHKEISNFKIGLPISFIFFLGVNFSLSCVMLHYNNQFLTVILSFLIAAISISLLSMSLQFFIALTYKAN